jgi:hypothetical protein
MEAESPFLDTNDAARVVFYPHESDSLAGRKQEPGMCLSLEGTLVEPSTSVPIAFLLPERKIQKICLPIDEPNAHLTTGPCPGFLCLPDIRIGIRGRIIAERVGPEGCLFHVVNRVEGVALDLK